MGELIRVLGQIELSGNRFDVELNHGAAGEGSLREIHIQSERFRLAMPETEFLQLSAAVMLAKKQLEIIKEKSI